MAVADPYAAAKAALRDNVKTLTAVFAGVAGVMLAGSPFSGFGALQGGRLWVAGLSLLVMVLLVGASIWRLLVLLRPDLVYVDTLGDDFKIEQVADKAERAEIEKLRAEFGRRKRELLPPEEKSIETYKSTVEALAETARRTKDTIDVELWKTNAARLEEIGHWAGFVRLHRRIGDGLRRVMVLGLLALLSIFVFAWAVNPPKDALGAPTTNVVAAWPSVTPQAAQAAQLPEFEPVLFATDSAALSAQAIERIAFVRDHLRAHPQAGVLVYGHTDTMGSERHNAGLARRRADAVAGALLSPGGVAVSRVFVAPVGPADLPVLTGPQVDQADNRSARFLVLDLPKR